MSNRKNGSTKVMFVLTTDRNMGDLALCIDWVNELRGFECSFAFVIPRVMQQYLPEDGQAYCYDAQVDVMETIGQAADDFQAQLVIFASNSFWNIRGQQGAQFGRCPSEMLGHGYVVAAFDPFEIEFENTHPVTREVVRFKPVHEDVVSLRYMSWVQDRENLFHFRKPTACHECSGSAAETVSGTRNSSSDTRTLMFAISEDRMRFINRWFPDYFDYLASLLEALPAHRSQLLIVAPERIEPMMKLSNAVHCGILPHDEFRAIVKSTDLYLTDSIISCISTSFQLERPSVLLTNSNQMGTPCEFFHDTTFQYRVFPHGLYDAGVNLVERFEIENCFESVEVLDQENARRKLFESLFDEETRSRLVANCKNWNDRRSSFLTPFEILTQLGLG